MGLVNSAAHPDLIVVGDAMVDVAVEAGALVSEGDVHGEIRIRPAGAGANAAVWAAWHGARVRFFGRVGKDIGGRLMAEALAERGVDSEVVADPGARTGSMLVVRRGGERSMVADRGANARLSVADLPERLEAGAVLVSGYLLFDPGSEDAAVAALERAAAGWVAVDAASWPLLERYGSDRFLEVTKVATVLLANEHEARTMAREGSSPEDAAAQLGRDRELVVIKRGPAGVVAARRGRLWTVPGLEVEEADPTGAGDAFDGVLLAELAAGASVERAMAEASRAGAAAASSFETWPER